MKIELLSLPTPTTTPRACSYRDSIVAFERVQQAAFDAERRHWAELRIDEVPDEVAASAAVVEDIPDGYSGVFSEVPGNVWKIFGDVGAAVAAGDVLAIIEFMKMEISVLAPATGRIASVRIKTGQTLRAGDVVAVIKEGRWFLSYCVLKLRGNVNHIRVRGAVLNGTPRFRARIASRNEREQPSTNCI